MTMDDLMERANEIFDKGRLDKADIEKLREIQDDLETMTNDEQTSLRFGELIAQAIIDPNVYNP